MAAPMRRGDIARRRRGRIAADVADRQILRAAESSPQRREKTPPKKYPPECAHLGRVRSCPPFIAIVNPSSTLTLSAKTAKHHFTMIARIFAVLPDSVAPPACNAANRIADFTWALAIGMRYSMPAQAAAGDLQRRQAVAGRAANPRAHQHSADRSCAAWAAGGATTSPF